jgi:hypothetical protein
MQLADHCRKEALKNPGGCKDAAVKAAEAACAGTTGMGRGNCMNANFERYLVEACGEKVCPGDPFMIKETTQRVSSRTSASRADEGGMFKTTQELTETEFHRSETAQGADPNKVRNMVFGGLALMVVLVLATSKKK